VARRGGFDAYTTSLLYSRFQDHERIRETGEAVARSSGVPFLYEDFRAGWKEGIEESRRLELYRQQYCGCIYSEKERYAGRDRKPETAPPPVPGPPRPPPREPPRPAP
jgi:hypothetical protein